MMDETLNAPGTDAEAVAAVRRGDAERYRELVERHQRRVFAVAWSRLGDATLAEEATQEAFIRGYRRLWLLGDDSKFAGWITSIARNISINLGLRHRRELNKRERWALEQVTAPEAAADDSTPPCAPETLRQTLAELPAAHRECLVLFYLEGKSGAEAATALGISETAFRVRLHRARAALRERLDEHLADSLRKLGPAKSIVPAVMAAVLVSTSAKAATAGSAVGGGFLGAAGKVIPFSALFPLIQIIGSLPGVLFAMWIARLERRNFRDADGFRVQLHRGFYRSFLWGFPLAMLLILLPIHFAQAVWGMKGMYLWVVSFMLVLTLISARSLVINRNLFNVGMFSYCLVLTIGTTAVALEWIPRSFASLPMALGTILFITLLNRHRPTRMDYNLFLRASQGLLKNSTATGNESPQQYFERSDLLAFGRFLGSRWLAAQHRWNVRGLVLRLPPVKSSFGHNMVSVLLPMSRDCSRLLLGANGTVVADCGDSDAEALVAINPETNDLAEVEAQVETATLAAWRAFRSGNLELAGKIVGDVPDAEVFLVPPARAAAMRRMRWVLVGAVVLMLVSMVMSWKSDRVRMVSGRHLKPVTCSEADVQATLARWGEAWAVGGNAWRQFQQTMWPAEVLPPATLFPSNAWQIVRTKLFGDLLPQSGSAFERIDRFLGTPDLLKAVANGWFSISAFGVSLNEFRQTLQEAPAAYHRRWFVPDECHVSNHNGEPMGYTGMMAEQMAGRILCLKKLGCLDVVDGSEASEILARHQLLSEAVPTGRRILPYPKLAHGTFLLMGQDPIRDTYHALVILDGFGALDRIDREACIQGILRFHHGKGLFGAVKQGDGFVIFGDSRNTFWAFESLRMLGGLDRVKDLDQWKFRPGFTSIKSAAPDAVRDNLTGSEIEAWALQQRLERIFRERKENPQAPISSLLEP